MESSATPDANARRVAALRTPSGLGSLLSVMAGGEPESLRMLCGDADFGTAMLERYAVVPGFFNPRVLLPLDGSEAALGAALAQHASGAASPVVRAAARGLHLANRLGLAQSFLRHRIPVVTGTPDRPATRLTAKRARVGKRGAVRGI